MAYGDKGLLYKLGKYIINDIFLILMASYLGGMEQRVVMQNGNRGRRLQLVYRKDRCLDHFCLFYTLMTFVMAWNR